MSQCIQKLLIQWNVTTLNVACIHELQNLKINRDTVKNRKAPEEAKCSDIYVNRVLQL